MTKTHLYGVFYMLLVNSNYCTTKTYTHPEQNPVCLFFAPPCCVCVIQIKGAK